MRIVPYDHPKQHDFTNKKKFDVSKIRKAIQSAKKSSPDLHLFRYGPWMVARYGQETKRPKKGALWNSKLYVTVAAQDFHQSIAIVADICAKEKIQWKYFSLGRSSSRPDRVVLYPGEEALSKKIQAQLEKKLKGLRSYQLSHCKYPGNSKRVGMAADPTFIDISWRVYRTLALMWLKNNSHLLTQYGIRPTTWLKKMNISLKHGGPIKTGGTKEDIMKKFITHYWRIIGF